MEEDSLKRHEEETTDDLLDQLWRYTVPHLLSKVRCLAKHCLIMFVFWYHKCLLPIVIEVCCLLTERFFVIIGLLYVITSVYYQKGLLSVNINVCWCYHRCFLYVIIDAYCQLSWRFVVCYIGLFSIIEDFYLLSEWLFKNAIIEVCYHRGFLSAVRLFYFIVSEVCYEEFVACCCQGIFDRPAVMG